MASKEEGIKFVMKKENRENLKKIGRQLNAVARGRGFFNITKLSNMGLIKRVTVRKGQIRQGVPYGKKTKYVLTEKGKRVRRGISSL